MAKINSENLGFLDRSKYINLNWNINDWDEKLTTIENNLKYDIVITNPPYIPTNLIKTLKKEVKNYDPFIALNGGKDGLNAYKSILPKLRNIIKSNGKIFLEIGEGQEIPVKKIATGCDLYINGYKKDLSGTIRAIML